MNNPIPVPIKGDGMKATWAASVANGINELMPMAASGMLTRNGAGGVGSEPLPENRRERRLSQTIPWTFRCSISNQGEDNETRTGGWSNCILQLGYNKWLVSPDVVPASERGGNVSVIQGTSETSDGAYVVEVDLKNETAVIKIRSSITHTYPVDAAQSIVYIDIGTVEDSVQTTRIPSHPIVYKYA